MNLERTLPRLLGGTVVGMLAIAIAFAVRSSTRLPDEPVKVAWDKAACAHCRMHLGEPRFAAQLVQQDGTVALFDDPGCLFAWQQDAAPAVHAIWFHALEGDRWLRAPDVAFATVQQSPMGYCLGAVDKGTPHALGYDEAGARCRGEKPSGGHR